MVVTTLLDLPPATGAVVLIGINPAPISVQAGHYYQGTLGKRLWRRLERIGLLESPIAGREDEAWTRAGNGLTDIVKRPTPSARELSSDELENGAIELREKLRHWKPGLVLFAFREPARRLLGDEVQPGRGPELDGTLTFLLSGPYAPRDEATQIDDELRALLRLAAEKRPDPVTPAPALTEGAATTQRVTATDIANGQIRLPRGAKHLFPRARTSVEINLRGEWLQVSYDPRTGPDRERSGVLRVGRNALAPRVRADEVLRVRRDSDGTVSLD